MGQSAVQHVVWTESVDGGRWLSAVRVDVEDPRLGVLRVYDEAGTLIHDQQVIVADRAPFGPPDVDDVWEWRGIVVDVIDDPSLRRLPEPEAT